MERLFACVMGMAGKWAAEEKLKRKDLAAALLTAIGVGVQKV